MKTKTLLIGGTSHMGKSTLAAHLATITSAKTLATDHLARHPGRPWKDSPELIPPHVKDHYQLLEIDELIEDVLAHYRRLWPQILASTTASETQHQIIEGSAIWPDWIAPHLGENVQAIWLVGEPRLIKERIYQNSKYSEKSSAEQFLIDKFCQRSINFNAKLKTQLEKWALPCINITHSSEITRLSQQCLEEIGWALEP